MLGHSQILRPGQDGSLQYQVPVAGPFLQSQVTEDGNQKFIQVTYISLLL